eukprot:Pgem_evm1s7785
MFSALLPSIQQLSALGVVVLLSVAQSSNNMIVAAATVSDGQIHKDWPGAYVFDEETQGLATNVLLINNEKKTCNGQYALNCFYCAYPQRHEVDWARLAIDYSGMGSYQLYLSGEPNRDLCGGDCVWKETLALDIGGSYYRGSCENP